jgi:hypothetical protein
LYFVSVLAHSLTFVLSKLYFREPYTMSVASGIGPCRSNISIDDKLRQYVFGKMCRMGIKSPLGP